MRRTIAALLTVHNDRLLNSQLNHLKSKNPLKTERKKLISGFDYELRASFVLFIDIILVLPVNHSQLRVHEQKIN